MARHALLWRLALLMTGAGGMQAAGPPRGDIDGSCFLQLHASSAAEDSERQRVRNNIDRNLAGLRLALSKESLQQLAGLADVELPNTFFSSNASTGNNPGPVYDLLVIIPCAAGERERRDAIRKSWMRYMHSPCCESCRKHSVKTIFIVGNESNVTASHAEANETGDLHVLDDFGQSEYYTAMSEKTAFSIKYAVEHFNFRFLLKADSDSWVFYDRLLSMFDEKQLWLRDRLYAGNFIAGHRQTPHGDAKSKWYDPVYGRVTPNKYYPKHAKGPGYVLSRSLAEYVATVSPEIHEILPQEDVAVGFWLTTIKKQIYELPVKLKDACGNATDGPVIDHYVFPLEKMRERWSSYELTGDPCMNVSALSSFNGSQAKPKCAPTL